MKIHFISSFIGILGLANSYIAPGVCPSYSDAPSKRLLSIDKYLTIVAFENSPWPSYNAHSLTIKASQEDVKWMIRNGTRHKVTSQIWLRMLSYTFTIPSDVLALHRGAANAATSGDLTPFSIKCEGAIVIYPRQILFWSVLNDQNIYLTDGTASCIITTDRPLKITSASQTATKPLSLGNPPRHVESAAAWPDWMQDLRARSNYSLSKIKSLFTTGSVTAQFDMETETPNESPSNEMPLCRELEIFAKIREQSTKYYLARNQSALYPELTIPRGVFFYNDKLLFWRYLDNGILELRSNQLAGLIVGENN